MRDPICFSLFFWLFISTSFSLFISLSVLLFPYIFSECFSGSKILGCSSLHIEIRYELGRHIDQFKSKMKNGRPLNTSGMWCLKSLISLDAAFTSHWRWCCYLLNVHWDSLLKPNHRSLWCRDPKYKSNVSLTITTFLLHHQIWLKIDLSSKFGHPGLLAFLAWLAEWPCVNNKNIDFKGVTFYWKLKTPIPQFTKDEAVYPKKYAQRSFNFMWFTMHFKK